MLEMAVLELDYLPFEILALLSHAGQLDPAISNRREQVGQSQQNQPAGQQQHADPIQGDRPGMSPFKRQQHVAHADQNAQQ